MSFEDVALPFLAEEWALLDPGQRKLYWEVMQENCEMVASLADYNFQKDLQASELSILSFLDVDSVASAGVREGRLGNLEVTGPSLLPRFPRLVGEFGFCLSAGEGSPPSFEEVAVPFVAEEWALLDPAQRELYWQVMEENFETVVSLGERGSAFRHLKCLKKKGSHSYSTPKGYPIQSLAEKIQ